MSHFGWICPRCSKVHAPSVLTCTCVGTSPTWPYPSTPTWVSPTVGSPLNPPWTVTSGGVTVGTIGRNEDT